MLITLFQPLIKLIVLKNLKLFIVLNKIKKGLQMYLEKPIPTKNIDTY